MEKQIGITKIEEITFKSNHIVSSSKMKSVIFEGLSNVKSGIVNSLGGSFDYDEIVFSYKNISSEQIKMISFYAGEELKNISMFDSKSGKWTPMDERYLNPGDEIKYRISHNLFDNNSNIIYFIKPVVKFVYRNQTYSMFDLSLTNYNKYGMEHSYY